MIPHVYPECPDVSTPEDPGHGNGFSHIPADKNKTYILGCGMVDMILFGRDTLGVVTSISSFTKRCGR